MAARPDSLGQDLKAWAADQLRVAPGAAPEQIRAAYLRQVEHGNGGPNLTAREALLILCGRIQGARPALALDATEEKLHREVDDFAKRFFSLPIAERKGEWQMLWTRGQGFVRVDARLAALRPGLFTVSPHLDLFSEEGQLLDLIRQLFVLRPAARAAKRQAFLLEAFHRGKWHAWVRAAVWLRENHKALAALEPEVIGRLADADAIKEEKQQLTRTMRKTARPNNVGAGKSSSNLIWIILVVVGAVVRLAVGTSSSKTKPNFVPPPEIKPLPQFDPNLFFKDKKIRMWKNGEKWELKVEPDGGLVGEAKKDNPAEEPKKQQDPP